MPVMCFVHCTNAEGGSRTARNQAGTWFLTRVSGVFVTFPGRKHACGQIGVPAYCCSAALRSAIAKPPPFLGVSSLNLAALRSGHFFSRFFCVLAVSPLRSWTFSPLRSRLLASPQNLSRKVLCSISRETALRAPARQPKSLRQKRLRSRGSRPARKIPRENRCYSAASGSGSRPPSCDSGIAVSHCMARVSRARTASKDGFLAIRSSSRYSARLISICSAWMPDATRP